MPCYTGIWPKVASGGATKWQRRSRTSRRTQKNMSITSNPLKALVSHPRGAGCTCDRSCKARNRMAHADHQKHQAHHTLCSRFAYRPRFRRQRSGKVPLPLPRGARAAQAHSSCSMMYVAGVGTCLQTRKWLRHSMCILKIPPTDRTAPDLGSCYGRAAALPTPY